MTKVAVKIAAIQLRKAGHSYNRISELLGVSKSTLSGWLPNVPYTPNQETIARIGRALAASGEAKSKIKRESIEFARKTARTEIGKLTKRDLHMLGLGLYIGEGMKSTQITRFVNSNPAIMKIIIRWFVEVIGVPKGNLTMRVHLYPDSNERRSLQFWSEATNIPISQFQKTQIDRRVNKRALKAGKLPHGTAHLTVRALKEKRFGVFLARKILGWSDAVLGTDELRV